MLRLLFSAAPPRQASPLTSPAEKSAFMFLSNSQVVLPWATLTEPGAKAALSCVPAQTRTAEQLYAHRNTRTSPAYSTNALSAYPPTL